MSTNSLLVNYVGYPLVISNLMPDDGLASLASSLIHAGHNTKILDYSTVKTVERLIPSYYKNELEEIIGEITSNLSKSVTPSQAVLEKFYSLDRKLITFHNEKTREIASELNSYIEANDVDFVGFKLFLGEGFFGSIDIAKELKKRNPRLKVFGGGPQVDWFKDIIYEVTDVFDALAYGEGEETVVQLAEYVEGKKEMGEINNLIYKKNGQTIMTPIKRIENLNELPFPVYDEETYSAMKGDDKIKIILLDESRGCPNSCNFCIHPLKSGKQWRTKSPGRIVDEMEKMISDYGIRAFRFAGSNTPPALHRNIAEEIIKRDLKVTYSGFGHVGNAYLESYDILKKSGCHALFFGVESGSQYILDNSINKKSCGKRTTLDDIEKAFSACKAAGIYSIASLIFPAPLETEQTKEEGLEFIIKLKPDSAIVSLPGVVLGTEWERNHEKYNIEIADEQDFRIKLMAHKPKFTYPPVLWDPIPYKINGKEFKEYMKESSDFALGLEKAGILMHMTDEMLVMAKYSGMPLKEFRDKSRHYISIGDYDNLGQLINRINSNIQN